jgi:C4-dicarboxylate-specific signal transduction histidine kinase
VSAPFVATATELAPHRDFASNVFHDLSQPLTALQCSLELALVRDQTIEEFRASVEAALHNAERLRQRLLLLRELSNAEDPGDTSTPLPLDRLLQQLREDMLPLFESAGRSFELTCEPVQVPANEAKLMRGFFYLLEFLLRCASPSCHLRLRGRRTDQQQVEICIEGCGASAGPDPSDDGCDPDWSGELEISRRTFRAVGGDLIWMASAGLPGVWVVRLPCVS